MAKGHPSNEGESFPPTMGSRVGIDESTVEKVREMRDANTIQGLIQERGRKGLPLERIYRLLFDPELYLTAYGKIYRNKGAMTPGTTEETADGMSMEKVTTIIEALRYERYNWKPVRRVSIEKKNSTKKQAPGMPTWSDKVVQEIMRMILTAYYEPQFSEHSHAFRPQRGCHTALREIYYTWPGTVWFIEGDISQCFDQLDHEVLTNALSEKIHDGRFINLVKGLLQAGYIEDWKMHETHSGSPQGGIISPILANIYLDKLDKYVEQELIPTYTRGKGKAANAEYNKLNCKAHYLHRKGRTQEAKAVKRKAQHMPSKLTDDPNFRRLRYIRYADDFLLGFIGTKEEAEEIKEKIRIFLKEMLNLELSPTKTLITHARTEPARFLGYAMRTTQEDTYQDKNRRTINGNISLRVPEDILREKCQRYMHEGKAVQRAELIHDSDLTIVNIYQSEYRGFVEYYRLANNLHSLNKLKWIMEQSLTKTLANKHKMSVKAVYTKYGATFEVDKKRLKGLQVIKSRDGKDPLIAKWGGIPLVWDIKATLNDHIKMTAYVRTELEQRLLANACEYCGDTEQIQVHHIRAMKDLNKYPGREKPEWVQIMAARQRKTMVVCRTCHEDITYGRPMRKTRKDDNTMRKRLKARQTSSS